eukprot:7389015-Prymnesium_polylepis.1
MSLCVRATVFATHLSPQQPCATTVATRLYPRHRFATAATTRGDESARLEAATGEGRDYVTLGEFKSGAVGDVAVLGTHDVPAAAAPVVEAAGAAAAA